MYKEIFQHEIFKNELDFRLYTLILGNAVYQEEGVVIDGVHVKKGQWLRSYRKLAKDLEYKVGRGYKQYDIATIKRSVTRLEKAGFIRVFNATDNATDSATINATLFEVVEFEKYQGVSQPKEPISATDNATDSATDSETKLINKKNKEKDKDQPSGRSTNQYTPEFEKFWSIYPRKVGKLRAFELWKKRLTATKPELRSTVEEMIQAAINYRNYCEQEGTEQKYIKHPSTFLSDNMDFQDWIDYQNDKIVRLRNRSNSRDSREETIEKKRLQVADFQVAVNRFVSAGFDPDRDRELFQQWIERGAKPHELNNLRRAKNG